MASSPDNELSDSCEWDLLITSGVNAILCGDRPTLDATLSGLRTRLALPLHEWSCNNGSSCPTGDTGTLIVNGLENATVEQQRGFLRWLDTHATVRVITLSERPLFRCVERGTMSETLYYRLNPLYLTPGSVA